MQWTPCLPKVEGFYWVKCRGILSGKEYIQVAKVYESRKGTGVDTVFLEGENSSLRGNNIVQFSDTPISPPQ